MKVKNMTLLPTETEQGNFEKYERHVSGDYIITEEFPDEVRQELLLEARDLINKVAAEKPDEGFLYEESGQSGDIHMLGLGDTPDTLVGIRVSKAIDENEDGSLMVFRSAYGNTSEQNPAIVVSFGPTGNLLTAIGTDAHGTTKKPVPEKEAVAFARDMMKKVQEGLSSVES